MSILEEPFLVSIPLYWVSKQTSILSCKNSGVALLEEGNFTNQVRFNWSSEGQGNVSETLDMHYVQWFSYYMIEIVDIYLRIQGLYNWFLH